MNATLQKWLWRFGVWALKTLGAGVALALAGLVVLLVGTSDDPVAASLEVLRIFVSWPVAVLLIILKFRGPLTTFIENVTHIKSPWGNVERQPPTQQVPSIEISHEVAASLGAAAASEQSDEGLLPEAESSPVIRTTAQTMLRLLPNTPDRVKRLLHIASTLYVRAQFQDIYRLVFGSQIAALEFLNRFPQSEWLAVSGVQPFYESASSRWVEFYKTYNFHAWQKFLFGTGLVEGSNGQLRVTILGREFLKWILQGGLPMYKDF